MFQHLRRRVGAVAAAVMLAGFAGATQAGAATASRSGVHHARTHSHHRSAPAKNTVRSRRPKAAAVPLGRHVAFGAFAAGFGGPGLQITQLEKELGAHLAIASSFQGFGDVFPDATERSEAAAGHALLVSWSMGSSADTRFSTFTTGAHDAYLAQVAHAVAAFGKPVYIRPWAEMNGDWVPFQPTADGTAPAGGTPAEFVAAWRYVVDFFRAHGAANARWVFNPTTDTYAETTDVATIFPGASYVDVLGLDGYNWGDGGSLHWRSFQSIYATQYQRIVALDPAAPVWVCEFASKEPAEDDGAPADATQSKAAWYRALLASTAFPAIKALVMFDVDKERDWRVASDPQALAVVSAAVKAAA
jgi:hypothetical protein